VPGIAGWKDLYQLEHVQLHEEGYDVCGCPRPGNGADDLAVEDATEGTTGRLTETEWEQAYRSLVRVREAGLRDGYPYVEPNEWDAIVAAASAPPDLVRLTDGAYADRIKGAWLGRMAGCIQGKPVEMVRKDQVKEYLQEAGAWELYDYIPLVPGKLRRVDRLEGCTRGHITRVARDDDVDYTILSLILYETHGRSFTREDICNGWLNRVPYGRLYSCTRQAYYHLVNRDFERPIEEQIDGFATTLNPMREGINGTIRADFHAYVTPGDPRAAAANAWKEATINCVKNGIYGMCFTAAAISAALSDGPGLETILAGGLSVVPRRSRLYEAIAQVRTWHAEGAGWESVNDRIYEKWGHHNCAGVMINLPIVVLALLEGKMDFTRTISVATMAGMDTDCNAATAGSIVGAALGYEQLDGRWFEPFQDTVESSVAMFGNGTISELIERTVACYHKCGEG